MRTLLAAILIVMPFAAFADQAGESRSITSGRARHLPGMRESST